MRAMVFVPANKESEAGKMPTKEQLGEMMKFNEELSKAGVMLAGDGLTPTSRAKRVRFSGNGGTEVTIRPIFGPEDFGAELTPELRAKREQLEAEIARR